MAWRAAQARFVDDPLVAITEADALVQDLMQSRGYPVGDFEERVAVFDNDGTLWCEKPMPIQLDWA